jgi:hypothetical protein
MPRHRSHHLHLPHFKFDDSHNLRMLYGLRVTRELINNLVYFFLPLFLFKIGPKLEILSRFDLTDFQKGMITLGIFYFLVRFTVTALVLPVGKVISRFLGSKNAFIISRMLGVVAFLLLRESTANYWLIFLIPFVEGFEVSFFWPNFNNVLSRSAKAKRMGEDLGLLQFLLQFVAMAAPAAGGIIAMVMGYDKLFLIGIVLSLVGLGFTVAMHPEKATEQPKYLELLDWLKERRFRQLSVTMVGRYISDSVLYIWPLYVFLILGAIDKVGFLYSFALFISMILSFFIGFYIDHNKSKKPYFFSGGVLSFLWFLRMQVVDVWSIVAVDVSNKLFSSFHWLFYDSILLKRSQGKKSFSFFVYREMIMGFGGAAFWLLLVGVFLISDSWQTLFLVAAVGTLASLLISEKTKLK